MARGDRLKALVSELAAQPERAVVDKTTETFDSVTAHIASLPPEEGRKWQKPQRGSWMTMHPLEFAGIADDGKAQMRHAATHWNEVLKTPKRTRTLEFSIPVGEIARTLRVYARNPQLPVEMALLEAFTALTASPQKAAPAAPVAEVLPARVSVPQPASNPVVA